MPESNRKRRQGMASARLEETRREQARQERLRRLRVSIAATVSVVVVLIAVVLVGVLTNHSHNHDSKAQVSAETPVAAPASLVSEVTAVPSATLNTIGAGSTGKLKAISGQPALTADGKPELLYMGAEFCPYCAAERWAITEALSHFGTFTGLDTTYSSVQDGHIPTLSFVDAKYTSSLIDFQSVEWSTNIPDSHPPSWDPFAYGPLQRPTSTQLALFDKYDSAPFTSASGAIPFFDLGNRYLIPGAGYNPDDIQALTPTQVAAALADPTSAVAKDIDGTANELTAAICTLTNGAPASVCNSAATTAGKTALDS